MAANNGGTLSSSDTISVGTAYLYNRFARGQLESYGAQAMQDAVHYLEGERTDEGSAVTLLNWLNGQGLVDITADASYNLYGVTVLNIWGDPDHTVHKQDQLYYDGSNRVPDGGMTLALLGSVLAGMVSLRRLRK
jgi:hypothetical protein